jgi:predicted O-methyltransferase YrrM
VIRTRSVLLAARIVDVLATPFTALAAVWLKALRRLGLQYMPVSRRLLLKIGVLPVRDHYYEPLVNPGHLRLALTANRHLRAIDLNDAEQLAMLAQFDSQKELREFPLEKTDELTYYYHNPNFGSGDAEYLYSLIRLVKPRKIIEIGSGFSTLMARSAIRKNELDAVDYACDHVCIEPYEQPWLERLGIQIMRRRVEDCDVSLFASLRKNDILFIDSSHVIRPQGDVLFEYFELLPVLQSGVYVHIHDIFTPRDYPAEWVVQEIRLWNEQYLVEAFLSFNTEFRIIGALNYLMHNYPEQVAEKFPILKMETSTNEPASLWMVRA